MSKKQVKQPVVLAQKAIEIVSDFFNNPIEGESVRQRCINYFQTQLGMKELMAKTYYRNALTALLNQDKVAAEKAMEAGKPVHSVFKINGENVVTSVGYFTKVSVAKAFNKTFGYHGVAPGVVINKDEQIDPSLIKVKAVKPKSKTESKSRKAA